MEIENYEQLYNYMQTSRDAQGITDTSTDAGAIWANTGLFVSTVGSAVPGMNVVYLNAAIVYQVRANLLPQYVDDVRVEVEEIPTADDTLRYITGIEDFGYYFHQRVSSVYLFFVVVNSETIQFRQRLPDMALFLANNQLALYDDCETITRDARMTYVGP